MKRRIVIAPIDVARLYPKLMIGVRNGIMTLSPGHPESKGKERRPGTGGEILVGDRRVRRAIEAHGEERDWTDRELNDIANEFQANLGRTPRDEEIARLQKPWEPKPDRTTDGIAITLDEADYERLQLYFVNANWPPFDDAATDMLECITAAETVEG